MADAYDFLLTLDLRDDLSEDEVAELRWHLGLGPQPERLCIITEFPEVVLDDAGPALDDKGEFRLENTPYPVWAQQGPAWRIGGAAVSGLARREDPRPGWALTTRQALHPDDFDYVDQLLGWLATHADYDYGYAHYVGFERFYEDAGITKLLMIKDGEIVREG
ncbi:hypothetical protein [Streptomyces chattanoogensis]|uniref:Uncharacterized protein n=1 Tax=Streptomyces chattanoogensis TaxID=66876 RepID=A0A0N0H1N0_9ACTN|nr:hypothetical protein [Streptomyces chattanoogensis]KPC64652.1 hypothetical protein ADL29_10685 [Streptomyces chattanoogensis]